MSTHRNGIGQIKRTTGTRSMRRAHMVGLYRMVKEKKRSLADYSKAVFRAVLKATRFA